MSNENGTAASPIIKVLIGAVVFLVVVIALLAKLATSGFNGDSSSMTKEALAARLKPIGASVASDGLPGSRSGEAVFQAVCINCHGAGLLGSPKFSDASAWAPRIAKGYQTLVQHALSGFNAMPARGGNTSLTDDEVARAVAYMANAGGAKFVPPAIGGASASAPAASAASAPAGAAAPAAAATAPAAAPAAAAAGGKSDPETTGKKIYSSICINCHGAGLMGAPKFGDKAAWAARTKPGLDAVQKIATHGLNAMPPKGTFSGSDADFRSAIEYMVNHSK